MKVQETISNNYWNKEKVKNVAIWTLTAAAVATVAIGAFLLFPPLFAISNYFFGKLSVTIIALKVIAILGAIQAVVLPILLAYLKTSQKAAPLARKS